MPQRPDWRCCFVGGGGLFRELKFLDNLQQGLQSESVIPSNYTSSVPRSFPQVAKEITCDRLSTVRVQSTSQSGKPGVITSCIDSTSTSEQMRVRHVISRNFQYLITPSWVAAQAPPYSSDSASRTRSSHSRASERAVVTTRSC